MEEYRDSVSYTHLDVYKRQDKTIIHVPNEFEIVKRESFAIKSPSGETIANAVTDPDTKTVTITYANYVDSHSDISGSLHVTVKIDTDAVSYTHLDVYKRQEESNHSKDKLWCSNVT